MNITWGLWDLVFFEGPTKQDFDPHGDFKGKVGECSSTFSRLHIGCLKVRNGRISECEKSFISVVKLKKVMRLTYPI